MEHHESQFRDAESLLGIIDVAAGGKTPPLQANTQGRPLDYKPPESDSAPAQGRDNIDGSYAEDVQLVQSNQASEHNPSVGVAPRLQEAQAAFSANSEVDATTPRRTTWRVFDPQGTQDLNEETQDSEWTPRLALGSINAHQVGPREAARRHALQWDRICAFNEIQNPGSLPIVEKHRTEARRVYEELLASGQDEDVLPRNDLTSYQNERIQARTALLWKTLLETPDTGCEPMKANITSALTGYNTGVIGFSGNYTLIYAGHIVDTTCPTYSAFTSNRQERLDQYFEEYGPGYLWWEPPLAKGRQQVLAKKSTVLDLGREDDSSYTDDQQAPSFQDDACHYKVPLGFKKDDSMRRRLRPRRKRSVVAKETRPASVTTTKRKREDSEKVSHQEPTKSKREKDSTLRDAALGRHSAPTQSPDIEHDATEPPEDSAPTMFFDMLLDSGAELPILLHDDFALLGYTKHDMNAASVVELNAAAGQTSHALCFELRVGLELERSRPSESWIDQVAYSEARFFPCRVIKLPPIVKTPAYGAFSGDRLSGMLPFLAYYVASAPGNSKMCLGEKRAEVLGTQNMPAGLEYDPFNDAFTERRVRRREQITKIHKLGGEIRGLRKVTLETGMEDGRRLIDEDVLDESGGEISSNIGIINKYGDLIESWTQGNGKSKARFEQR